jgi:hypothetical protein
MLTLRSSLVRRIASALEATPSRIPVLVGGCGTGRTTLLEQLRDRAGHGASQYVDVERTATTPERFGQAVASTSPFAGGNGAVRGARASFDATLAFMTSARTIGDTPAMFLLDEFLELRTFESFPGLRRVLHDFVDGLAASPNRFVLTSRYATRTARLLLNRSPRFEIMQTPAFTPEETVEVLRAGFAAADSHEADFLGRTVHALGDGRPAYVRALGSELSAQRGQGGSDPLSALAALLAGEGKLSRHCHFCYELRLHRARGYGALKAILEILAENEGLTLTEISLRLQRTPGSTKDYLSWLEDVDLVVSRQKRYSFADPLLRVWVRLHCRPTRATEDDIAREVHSYALPRLPAEPELAMAAAGAPGIIEDDKKAWGIIEID